MHYQNYLLFNPTQPFSPCSLISKKLKWLNRINAKMGQLIIKQLSWVEFSKISAPIMLHFDASHTSNFIPRLRKGSDSTCPKNWMSKILVKLTIEQQLAWMVKDLGPKPQIKQTNEMSWLNLKTMSLFFIISIMEQQFSWVVKDLGSKP